MIEGEPWRTDVTVLVNCVRMLFTRKPRCKGVCFVKPLNIYVEKY